jgi:hypothetical protein
LPVLAANAATTAINKTRQSVRRDILSPRFRDYRPTMLPLQCGLTQNVQKSAACAMPQCERNY